MHVFVAVVVAMVVVRMGLGFWRAGRGGGRRNGKWKRGNGIVVVLDNVGMRVGVGGMLVLVLRVTVTCTKVVVIVVVIFWAMIMSSMRVPMPSIRMVVFIVRVVVSSMGMAVALSTVIMAGVAKSIHANQINYKAKTTDG